MITFKHPEPLTRHIKTLPVFLPFQGCPGRCTYCSQNLQTGEDKHDLQACFDELAKHMEERKKHPCPSLGLGFFGGTFTSLSQEWMLRFLKLGAACKEQGIISHIRCSTRPDAITPHILEMLAQAGLDMVELGIQSFQPAILERANRHYNPAIARTACTMIQEAGLELGLQMLPGLPGHTRKTWEDDIQICCGIRPESIRLYPCLVLEGTLLATWFHQGSYKPLSLEDATNQMTFAVRQLWARNIPVIRMGLTPEPRLVQNILAGPWHPCLGNVVRSRILANIIEEYVGEYVHQCGRKVKRLIVPRMYSGELWGYRKANVGKLQRLGITKENVCYADNNEFTLQ